MDIPPDGGMSSRDIVYADSAIRKMHRHEFRLCVLDENVPFFRRENTANQYENNSLMQCYLGGRASRLQEI